MNLNPLALSLLTLRACLLPCTLVAALATAPDTGGSVYAASGRARAPAPGTQFRECPNGCPEMVMMPRGSFAMGAPPGEEERENPPDYFRGHSVPQHPVTIQHKLRNCQI